MPKYLSRPPLPFRGPLAAILDLAGGVALQAVRERPLRRLAGILGSLHFLGHLNFLKACKEWVHFEVCDHNSHKETRSTQNNFLRVVITCKSIIGIVFINLRRPFTPKMIIG